MAQYKGGASEGSRGEMLLKEREDRRIQFELDKKKIEEKNKIKDGESKFQVVKDNISTALSDQTVGLVKLEDFRQKRKDLEKLLIDDEEAKLEERKKFLKRRKEMHGEKRKKKKKRNVSFEEEDEEAEEIFTISKKKDPTVETSFLPDQDRELEEELAKEKLRKEWLVQQEKIKEEKIQIVYSYWDGSGHRREVEVKKGNSIREFLEACLKGLQGNFYEMRNIGVDSLMYIKEDLIIPHHHTFYEFILNKARGKSGPLFKFDVHDDVRLVSDARKEKDESHAGKICQRSWYEKNKHMFPASRWETYNPEKDYGSYSIADKNKRK